LGRPSKMLTKRLLTAAVGVPILIGLLMFGGWVLVLGLGILASIMVYEMSRMMKHAGLTYFPWLAGLFVWAFFIAVPLAWPLGLLMALLAVFGAAKTLWVSAPLGFQGAVNTLWSGLYLGWFFSFFVRIRDLSHGWYLAFGFIVVIWLTDTAAYFVGRRFGRHKLTLRVSPGKTWEGSLGGTGAGMLAGMALAYGTQVPLWQGLLLGLVISVAGQIGDLVESNLKRYTGVKDSGSVLPGHGGMLDRFDSALVALPLAYYLLWGLGIR